eukprot:12426135-Karenia_brevis.AAC.1
MHQYNDGVFDDELMQELMRARRRSCSCSHPENLNNHEALELGTAGIGRFVRSLNKTELEYLSGYRPKWPGSGWQLNQDPETHGMHSI